MVTEHHLFSLQYPKTNILVAIYGEFLNENQD